MSARAFPFLLKILLWAIGIALALLLVGAAWVLWRVYSFDTETLPERHGQVDARLYAPAGPPRPLLVGLGGAEGGNSWTRDHWQQQRDRFQQQGYALLALGYFGQPNTPQDLDRIALEGVQEAIREAQGDPAVNGDCVILMGGSKGAELALLLAAHDPDIDAVVAMAPGDTVFPAHTDAMTTSSWSYRGEPLPFAPIPWSATPDLIGGNLHAVMERTLAGETAAAAAIPVERIAGPILLVAAQDDEMWPSVRMSRRMVERLEGAGSSYPKELVVVEGGHEAVVDHFDRVEAFLQEHVATQAGCRPVSVAES
ncbi:alpha/beta hydrolase family protein [Novilysobacter spongiicola]|uniref:BAAT / Acyl-CoA thioester hydrolase C terminal n=1 Tax=Lysobacter spongiicola DSM 21749 TaxID=1122188 RepID=A0A1T4R711_9GAMM|nr:acyl-CoA thioester hydrolase/BAAT C-terminal domain-containing protein [Lysobacter spongiicola]SKA11850.1 BAAT / Acyl-CoA thioester hydrolase C terminal [Lysobacter spongiicola DSM 21749]